MKELQTDGAPKGIVERLVAITLWTLWELYRALRLPFRRLARYPANANEFLSEFFTVTQNRELSPFFRNRINCA